MRRVLKADSRSRALHRLQEVQCYFTVWYRVDYGRSKELPADVTTSHVRQEVWSIRAEKPFSSLTASTTASAQGLPSSPVFGLVLSPDPSAGDGRCPRSHRRASGVPESKHIKTLRMCCICEDAALLCVSLSC